MKTTLLKTALAALTLAFNLPLSIYAQGTAFTYQGRLNNIGNPANGVYDLKFSLFNANAEGSALAKPVTNSAVVVSNGLFTTLVDFGSGAFTGGSNWLEIAVSTNGADSFATLMPRQPISPVPNAIFAVSASNLLNSNFVGTFQGDGKNIQNLSPSNIAPGLVQSMLTLNNPGNTFNGNFLGTFQGDGSGVENIQADAITGGLTTNIVVSVPAGTAILCFTNGVLRAVR